ncbi:tRNA lysidine(34) synthetase TilS [Sporolactobacillus sp. THM19-2]|uniref:tRNA lysidine(34) synthetase TilS n=1 Tax=Sporolactobacillus sp. THM19-2 TaxID=2511171 RepID=UPI001021AAA0|nr:tRNA lysidine(34) synthetase TilS [Sporolactobacillus sp. THM19-2]RYL89836.1 tRNA lysidine(34) synthetase TilS [Sporolactobacillus sp. THM19-2]
MDVQESVTQFIRARHLIAPGESLVAGVSGGADSMALLCYLLSRRKAWSLRLAVCSVDHGLRGAASRADLEYVAAFCRENGIIFRGKTVDVRSYSQRKRLSTEAAARALRYRAFAEVIREFHADALVLAHHGDDQVETMLMRAVRGSAGRARAGIPVRRPFAGAEIIRPFLTQTKAGLEAYCREKGIHPRYDTTNESEHHTRNRFRKHVLPFLKRENPLVHLKFQYESECISEDETYLNQQAAAHLQKVILQKSDDSIKLSIPVLLSLPSPLQRRLIHLILNYLYMNQHSKPLHQSIHIEHLLQLLRSSQPSGSTYFPHQLTARKSYTTCLVGLIPPVKEDSYETVLNIPGRTEIPAGTIRAQFLNQEQYGKSVPGPADMILNWSESDAPLTARSPRQGDRMIPNGMEHAQKVRRIFINEKIDRRQRSIWPLVVDGKGSIIWMPLLKRARDLEPGTPGNRKRYLKLTFVPAEDFGRTDG